MNDDKIQETNNSFIFDLKQYDFFKLKKNELYLKAFSLFENSIVYEDESLSIFCKSISKINRSEKEVKISLIFEPQVADTSISTYMLSCDNI